MKCPHCSENFHSAPSEFSTQKDIDGFWGVAYETCPACQRLIFLLHNFNLTASGRKPISTRIVRPLGSQRPPPPAAVISPYRDDYVEASAVLPISAKASAALSRRCLQAVLKDKGKFTQQNLIDQITAAESSGLPSHITESLHAVRQIGNFAAHPMKSTASGQVLDVEPNEAEWNLDTLDALFDFFFVQPDLVTKKKAALNAKLAAAGKPQIA